MNNNTMQNNQIIGYNPQTGQPIYSNQPQNNNIYPQQNSQNNKRNKKKWLFLILGIALIFIIAITSIILFKNFNTKKVNRTIMIYMVGSDLESQNSLATYDLKDIVPENIDLENNNILLMIGGSTKWHNFASEDETAIYQLSEEGFEKVKSYAVKNMGSGTTLTTFLTYAYNKSKAEKYDLIFWNHGLGTVGAGQDNLSNDYLSIAEFSTSLKNSPFNQNNKMESVLFLTCLTGNLHFAEVFDDYANYMIASEEISYAHPILDKLNFLEQITVDDNGYEYGVKFIELFKNSIETANAQNANLDSTYSIIDLSKIKNIEKNLNSFISDINVKENYQKIAYIRSNINQYGQEIDDYDTVDLYNFIYSLKDLAPSKAETLLNSINDAIKYNWSLNNYSKGIAIYFPYKATNSVISLHLNLLSKIDSSEYYDFISDFYQIKNGAEPLSYSLVNSKASATKSDFELQLTNDQVQNFAKASFMVFRDMGDGYYMPMYLSSDTTLNNNGTLTAKYNGKALKVIDNDDKSEETILLIEDEITDNSSVYTTFVTLNSYDEQEKADVTNAIMYLTTNKDNPNGKISQIIKTEDGAPSMALLDLKNYTDLYFTNYKYKILDKNGNYTENWESSGVSYLFRTGTNETDYTLKMSNLDDKYDYYCIFKVYDIYNNYHYSNLIKMK